MFQWHRTSHFQLFVYLSKKNWNIFSTHFTRLWRFQAKKSLSNSGKWARWLKRSQNDVLVCVAYCESYSANARGVGVVWFILCRTNWPKCGFRANKSNSADLRRRFRKIAWESREIIGFCSYLTGNIVSMWELCPGQDLLIILFRCIYVCFS